LDQQTAHIMGLAVDQVEEIKAQMKKESKKYRNLFVDQQALIDKLLVEQQLQQTITDNRLIEQQTKTDEKLLLQQQQFMLAVKITSNGFAHLAEIRELTQINTFDTWLRLVFR
jgi:hypothetical protein